MYSLTAGGMKDLRKCSFLHYGWGSLLLKELLRAPTVSCRGWEVLSMIEFNIASILLSPTSSARSRGQSKTDLANLLHTPCLQILGPSRCPYHGLRWFSGPSTPPFCCSIGGLLLEAVLQLPPVAMYACMYVYIHADVCIMLWIFLLYPRRYVFYLSRLRKRRNLSPWSYFLDWDISQAWDASKSSDILTSREFYNSLICILAQLNFSQKKTNNRPVHIRGHHLSIHWFV